RPAAAVEWWARGRRLCRVRIGQFGTNGFAPRDVEAPERADPQEQPGLGLGERPAPVLVRVVPCADGAHVRRDRRPAAGVLARVVEVAAPRRPGATGTAAVAVADPDVVGERSAHEPGARVRGQAAPGVVAARPRVRDLGPHPGPALVGRGAGGTGELVGGAAP